MHPVAALRNGRPQCVRERSGRKTGANSRHTGSNLFSFGCLDQRKALAIGTRLLWGNVLRDSLDEDEKDAIVSKVSQVLTAGSTSPNIEEIKRALVAKVVDIVLDLDLGYIPNVR